MYVVLYFVQGGQLRLIEWKSGRLLFAWLC